MSIFEQATRQKLRFQSPKGDLTTEQLWEMPLQSKSQFDLDTVAKAVNADLKAVTEESFVSTNQSPANEKLTLMLDVVKHVIAVRVAEAAAARQRADRAAERQKLLGILADKQDAALHELTPDEIKARLAALDS